MFKRSSAGNGGPEGGTQHDRRAPAVFLYGLDGALMSESADTPHEQRLLHALRRVHGGQVTVHLPDVVADGDQPFPRALVRSLQELFAHGQVRLEEEHDSGPRRVLISATGEDLLAELEDET